MGKPFSTKMLILLPQKSRCSVTTSKQSVVLGRLLAADTLLSRLEGLQRSEWDTETLGSHGRSTRLQVLVPKKKIKQIVLQWWKLSTLSTTSKLWGKSQETLCIQYQYVRLT